jgi:hypothetical protein
MLGATLASRARGIRAGSMQDGQEEHRMNGCDIAVVAAAVFGVVLIAGLGLLAAAATTESKPKGARKPSGATPSTGGTSSLPPGRLFSNQPARRLKQAKERGQCQGWPGLSA